ncbi:hypothetical protein [Clostridium sp. DL1XJH146]
MNENYETIDLNSELDTTIEIDKTFKKENDNIKSDCTSDICNELEFGYDNEDCCEGTFCDEFDKCEITKSITKQVFLECQGRLLRLHLKLKNVCTGHYINLGVVILNKKREILGFRVKKIYIAGPPHTCTDICKEFCFAFEDKNICKERKFKVLVIAQYC